MYPPSITITSFSNNNIITKKQIPAPLAQKARIFFTNKRANKFYWLSRANEDPNLIFIAAATTLGLGPAPPAVPAPPPVPAVPGFGRRRRQLPGGIPAVPAVPAVPTVPAVPDVPTVPAAPTVAAATTTDSVAAIVSKVADAAATTGAATTAEGKIDESKYKGLFEVGDCTKNSSFICIVI
jgi:hypothetical protein